MWVASRLIQLTPLSEGATGRFGNQYLEPVWCYVPPVELWEPKTSLKHVVEAVPVCYFLDGDRHNDLLHNGQ